MADANSSYTLADLPVLKEMDGLDLMMVEQPLGFEDLRDHALLQAQMETPICLDESIRGPGTPVLALELGSGRIINIKPGRVGGFTSSRQIHDLCAERGVPVWCGGMLEAGIGRAYNLALASLPEFPPSRGHLGKPAVLGGGHRGARVRHGGWDDAGARRARGSG